MNTVRRAVAGELPWRPGNGCVVVRVRLTPKSSVDRIDGLEDTSEGPALKARVRAVPEDGKANAALALLVAGWLGVAKSAVEVVGGAKSRVKTLEISGDPAEIARRLSDRVAAFG